jgi:hypothetical protein
MIEEELDLEGVSYADLDRDSSTIPAGWYHCEIAKVDLEEEAGKTPAVLFQFRVLEGTVKGQTNRLLFERLWRTEKNRDRRNKFAGRLGLVGEKDANSRPTIDWSDVQGKQCVIEVIEEEFDRNNGSKGKSSKVSYLGIYQVTDPRVSEVPKNKDALALAGITLPPPGTTTPAVGQNTTPANGTANAGKPVTNKQEPVLAGAGAGAGASGPPTIDI